MSSMYVHTHVYVHIHVHEYAWTNGHNTIPYHMVTFVAK